MNWDRVCAVVAAYVALTLCVFIVSCGKQSSNNELTATLNKAKDVSFGRRQIDQMLADRPDMVGILSDDDPILLWIIDGMNGDRIGMRIYWNANSPKGGASADHGLPTDLYPPHICVSGGQEITGVDKWACLVYELFNLEQFNEFYEAYAKAMEGKLDGNGYATECAKLEFVALKKAKKFFDEHPLPNALPSKNSKYDQLLNVPETFEEHMAKYHDSTGQLHHPGQQFRDYYDEVIAPFIDSRRRSEE